MAKLTVSPYIHQEVPLEAVLRFYADHFDDPEGRKLQRTISGKVWHEAFIDPVKRVVVFRLALSED